MSREAQIIGAFLLILAGSVAVGWFAAWLIEVPHDEIQTDFDKLKKKERL